MVKALSFWPSATKTTSLCATSEQTIYIKDKSARERAGCTGTEANKFSAGPLSHTARASAGRPSGRQSAEWKALIQKCGPARAFSGRPSSTVDAALGNEMQKRELASLNGRAAAYQSEFQASCHRSVSFSSSLSAPRTANHRMQHVWMDLYMQLRPAAL